MINNKKEAIKQILKLVKKYNISINDLVLLTKNPTNTTAQYSNLLIFLGIILIASAILALASQYWILITIYTKIILLLGVGVLTYLLMLKLLKISNTHLIIIPLSILSTVALAMGSFLFIDLLLYNIIDTNIVIIIVAILIMLQQFFTLLYLQTTLPLFFTILFASIAYITTANNINIKYEIIFIILGISYLLLSLYFERTKFAAITYLGFLLGSITLNISYYIQTSHSVFEYTILILFATQLYLGLKIKNKILIFVNAVSSILYLGHLTSTLFKESFLWVTFLSIAGVILVISALVKTLKIKS